MAMQMLPASVPRGAEHGPRPTSRLGAACPPVVRCSAASPSGAGSALLSRCLAACGVLLAAGRAAGRQQRGGRRVVCCLAEKKPRTKVTKKEAAANVKPDIRRVEPPSRSFFYSQCPPADARLPEIALFGRSNVGKSSMINFLCGRKLLSTISKHPGHTKLIHHFLCENSFYLVDLPGIGHAEGTGRQLKQMDKIVSAYIRHRETLVELLYLVDASLPPQRIDLEGMKWLVDSGVYISVLLTKTDKPRHAYCKKNKSPAEALTDALWNMEGSPWRLGQVPELPYMYETSVKARAGKQAILEHIADIRRRCILGALKRKSTSFQKIEADANSTPQFADAPPGIR